MNHDIMLAHASSNAASLCALCVHVAHKENSLTTCANTLLNWELRSLPSQKLRFFFESLANRVNEKMIKAPVNREV